MALLKGKKILIVGVASKLSIAAGIAESMHHEEAELAFTYQSDRLKTRVEALAQQWNTPTQRCFPCEVTEDQQIEQLFISLKEHWNELDGIVHAVGFAPQDQLSGNFVDVTTREGFRIAHDISAYSFIALAKAGRSMMQGRDGALLTLSYLGAVSTMPNYNVMGPAKASLEACVRWLAYSLGPEGTRVNAISAGPIKTLAASGIKNFKKLLKHSASRAPLKRNVTQRDVGNVAAFLCSDLSRSITGEITYVDAGFHNVVLSNDEFELFAT